MKLTIKTVTLFCAVILLLCFARQSTAQSNDPGFDPTLAAQLQAVLSEELSKQRLKGLSAAVIVPGQGLWQGASGLSGPSSSDVMRADMRFAIASIKKTFVAALVLRLAEEGVLSLDDSLHQWLPTFPFINSNLTLRQLLSHTSGIYNYTEHRSFWNTLWTDTQRVWMPEEILRHFIAAPVFVPSSRFGYSNTNFLLLSMVVRAVTGSSVSSLYRTRFMSPLNLTGTFVGAEEEVLGDLAHTWADHNGDGELEDIHNKVGPSMYTLLWPFMYSTAEDLAKWAEALYGGQLLNASSMNEMLNFTPVSLNPNWTGYGLGAMRYNFEGEELWGHSGLLPGLRSISAYSPTMGVSISVLVNQEDFGSIYAIAPALFRAVKTFLATSVPSESDPEAPAHIVLHPTYPNPFRGSTVIAFDVPRVESITIEVFDLHGRKLATLADGTYGPGRHRVRWHAKSSASGVYLYRLQAGTYSAVSTVLLMK